MCKYWVIDSLKGIKTNIDKIVKEMINDRISNPDGSGIYFYGAKSHELIVKKFYGITKDEIVEKTINECFKKFSNGSLLIYHNRFSTSGEKTKSQCHPIPVEHCDEYGNNIFKGWYIIHNGVLPDFEVEGINNLSDTQIVARSIGQWMYDHNIKSPLEFGEKRWKEYWETMFDGSKVTICYRDEYYTINDNLGVIEDGVWKSSSRKYGNYGMTKFEKEWLDSYYEQDGVVEYVTKDGKKTYEALEQNSIPDYDPNKKA